MNVSFSNRDPLDWSSAEPFPSDTFAHWRDAELDSAPITGTTQELDSSSWIDQASISHSRTIYRPIFWFSIFARHMIWLFVQVIDSLQNMKLLFHKFKVAARLASTRPEHPPFPPTTSYSVSGNSGHLSGSFGTGLGNLNLTQQQQQSEQPWNRMHFQQVILTIF